MHAEATRGALSRRGARRRVARSCAVWQCAVRLRVLRRAVCGCLCAGVHDGVRSHDSDHSFHCCVKGFGRAALECAHRTARTRAGWETASPCRRRGTPAPFQSQYTHSLNGAAVCSYTFLVCARHLTVAAGAAWARKDAAVGFAHGTAMEDVEVSESPPPVEAEPHAGDDECGSGAVAPDDSAPREGGDAAGADRDAELDGASVDAPGVAGSQAEPSSVVLSISSDDASGSAPMEGGGGGARADGGLEAAASPDAHRRHSPPSVHASAADDDVSGDEWGESPPAEGDGVFGSGQLINMSAMSRQAAGVDGGDGGKKSLLSRVKKGLSDRRRRSGTPTSSPASSPASGKHPAATIPDSGPDRGDASDAGEGGSTAPVGGAPHAEADAGAQSAGNVVGGAGGVADGEAGAAVPAAGVSKEELQRRRAAVKEEKKKEAALAKRTREWCVNTAPLRCADDMPLPDMPRSHAPAPQVGRDLVQLAEAARVQANAIGRVGGHSAGNTGSRMDDDAGQRDEDNARPVRHQRAARALAARGGHRGRRRRGAAQRSRNG